MTAISLLAAISAVILLQVAIGVGVGFWRLRHHGSASPPVESDALATTTGAWAGWREFRVDSVALEDEAGTHRTLILRPVDGRPQAQLAEMTSKPRFFSSFMMRSQNYAPLVLL